MYGEFTEWKPKKMREIREYCDVINADRKDIFEHCKENEYFKGEKAPDSLEDLSESDKLIYDTECTKYYNSYKSIWKEVI